MQITGTSFAHRRDARGLVPNTRHTHTARRCMYRLLATKLQLPGISISPSLARVCCPPSIKRHSDHKPQETDPPFHSRSCDSLAACSPALRAVSRPSCSETTTTTTRSRCRPPMPDNPPCPPPRSLFLTRIPAPLRAAFSRSNTPQRQSSSDPCSSASPAKRMLSSVL